MFKKVLGALVSALVVVTAGCGGGGGGGASAEPVSMSVSQQSIVAAATTSDTPPSVTFRMTVDHVPSGGLYVSGSYSSHGIDSAVANVSGNVDVITLIFQSPSVLGVGVYTDTLTLKVCRDEQCQQQVTNSPQQIAITYTVTAGSFGNAPSITTVSPTAASVGGSAFMLTVTGTGFTNGSSILWDGDDYNLSTTYVSSTQLSVPISSGHLGAARTHLITVSNFGSPSLTSNARSVTVSNAALSVTKLSPRSVTVGNKAYVQTVIGTGFDSSSIVQWNGSSRPTTFVSTTELLAQIGAADVASVATANIAVARSGSGTSNVKTLSIVAPSIDATTFQINPQHNGAINFANVIAPAAFPLTSKWTAPLNGEASYALVAGGRVFATAWLGAGNGSELTAFSAATGARLWGPIALPYNANAVYDNGRVFVLSADAASATNGILSAYDAATGTRLWNTALTWQYSFENPLTAANDMVYVVGDGMGATLYAVDQTTGFLTWTSSVFGSNSSPTVTADGVYVSFPCQTYDFRPATGALVWNIIGCTGGGGATGLAANGVVYSPNTYGGYSGMSFDAETGTYLSTYTADAMPVVGSTMGYFLRSGTLSAYNLSNWNNLWTFSGDGGLATPPILVNNYLFIFSSTGNLYALDATTGSQLWQTNMGGTMANNSSLPFTGLSAGGGLLVVPVGNTLVAYTLSNNP